MLNRARYTTMSTEKKLNNYKTWQLRMHCNLRPSDATPVLFRFNYDAHAKFEVAHPSPNFHRVSKSAKFVSFKTLSRPHLKMQQDIRILKQKCNPVNRL